MTSSSTRSINGLAELLDARADTREMLSANLNLAHAIVLLQRGNLEELHRALELAQLGGSTDALVIGGCVRTEVQRLSGSSSKALRMARELVLAHRFHTAAALHYRLLFSSIRSDEAVASSSPAVLGPAFELTRAEDDSVSLSHSNPPLEPADDAYDDEGPPAEPMPQLPEGSVEDLPGPFQSPAADPGLLWFVAASPGLNPVVLARRPFDSREIDHLVCRAWTKVAAHSRLGALRHVAVEGTSTLVHAWQHRGCAVTAVIEGGSSAPALAARLSRAFDEWSSETGAR